MTIIRPSTYQRAAALAPRATPGEAEMIDRLASKAQALAAVYGEPLSRKAAIKRVRENIAFVRQVAALKGVEW